MPIQNIPLANVNAQQHLDVSRLFRENEQLRSIENMLPLRWFYTLVNAHLCVLKLEASTYIHETRSIVTSATLAAAARPEGRIIVGCAVYAQQCISKQYAIIASTVTYCMQ